MFVVVGLGNPGPKYAGHRHNVGFMVVDRLAARSGAPPFRDKWKAEFVRHAIRGEDLVLLKPMTFMNLSGESVSQALQFFKVDVSGLLVVHDELDLPFGTLRLKLGGGAAGHNGLRSIIQHASSPDFLRVRFGIGRPRSQRPEGYVLSDFSAEERAELDDLIERAGDLVEAAFLKGPAAAMNEFHPRAK